MIGLESGRGGSAPFRWKWRVGSNPSFEITVAVYLSGREVVFVDGHTRVDEHSFRLRSEYPIELSRDLTATVTMRMAAWLWPRCELRVGDVVVLPTEVVSPARALAATGTLFVIGIFLSMLVRNCVL